MAETSNILDKNDTSPPANVKPAKAIDTSGSPQQFVPDIDMNHPAVDNDPRAGTTVNQNKIDFNDPAFTGQEAVERALNELAERGSKDQAKA